MAANSISTVNAVLPPEASVAEAADVEQTTALLRRAFGVELDLFDGRSGERLHASSAHPGRGLQPQAELLRQVARRDRPEFLDEQSPLIVLAIPLSGRNAHPLVAVGAFITRRVSPGDDLSQAAGMVGMGPEEAADWAGRQAVWAPEVLERVGGLVIRQAADARRIEELEAESLSLSDHMAATYEEISLLYRITQNLRISQTDEDLGRVALEWMKAVLPAEGLAIQLLPVAEENDSLTHRGRTESTFVTYGACPVDEEAFGRLIRHLDLRAATQPVVINPTTTDDPSWPFAEVRQMIGVALSEGENVFGNHVDGEELGTIEANLLSSVAAVLGIHSGNIELYRQQSELLSGIVRALTSAIDAKDPYTCGHSDRVARVAVRIARELDCDQQTINTIYLSGLLHDIGKIGIDDSVLRKPDKLTDEEYEHIKTHVRIGHRILQDLKKLDDVLPVVLYHHESWNGQGYPTRLAADCVPLPARIVAVADAFDAMGSDRPYRKGMPDEKIDEIFRSGAGKQWDPDVVGALFRARDDVRQIMEDEQDHLKDDLKRWT
ncbi:MAG: HD-GYP domain-containing protein [Planctomycetota bacterium]|jgi:hypothetical protein